MSKVVNIDDNRQHLVIESIDGNIHLIPVSFFIDVVSGMASLKDIEHFELIVPTIINDWISGKGIR